MDTLIKRVRSLKDIDIKHTQERIKYGISSKDAWSLDEYLADVIVRGITELQKQSHSYPPELTADEWNVILNKIKVGFLSYKTWKNSLFTDPKFRLEFRKYEESMKLFAKWFPHLWD